MRSDEKTAILDAVKSLKICGVVDEDAAFKVPKMPLESEFGLFFSFDSKILWCKIASENLILTHI